jgi:7-cyano-7-deazaguanine synthase in queuosine biosynthesis
MATKKKVLVLLSGAVESTVLLNQLIRNELSPITLFVNYSQRGAAAEFVALPVRYFRTSSKV